MIFLVRGMRLGKLLGQHFRSPEQAPFRWNGFEFRKLQLGLLDELETLWIWFSEPAFSLLLPKIKGLVNASFCQLPNALVGPLTQRADL